MGVLIAGCVVVWRLVADRWWLLLLDLVVDMVVQCCWLEIACNGPIGHDFSMGFCCPATCSIAPRLIILRDLKVLQADNMKLDTILPLLDILRMNVNLERVSLKVHQNAGCFASI